MRPQPKELGLAIIGGGRVGLFRGEVANRHPAVKWIGLAEKNPNRAGEVAPRVGADFVTHAAEALELVRAVAHPGLALHLDTACMMLAGDSWTDIANGVPSDFGFALEVDPNNADTAYIIPLNAAPGIPFERPSDSTINQFAQILADRGLVVSVRKSRGRDIRAACGQLIVEGQQKSPAQRLAVVIP